MTTACERLAAIWFAPHHTIKAEARALEDLKAEVRRLADADLPEVISWAFDLTASGHYRYWIVFALAHIERDCRDLACEDCVSEVRGYAGNRWRYRVVHCDTCPRWRAYREGRLICYAPPARNPPAPGVRGIPRGAVVTHPGPYLRRPPI